jgi:hypothetical protein
VQVAIVTIATIAQWVAIGEWTEEATANGTAETLTGIGNTMIRTEASTSSEDGGESKSVWSMRTATNIAAIDNAA